MNKILLQKDVYCGENVMKRIAIIIIVMAITINATAQCYQPNVDKGNAALADGKYAEAYDYFRKATKCPDASRFENGKSAKAGMRKCYPVLKIDGQKELNITVGRDAGERTFRISSSRLNSNGWEIIRKQTQNCEIVDENHQNNTITIKWSENKLVGNKKIYFYISGFGIDYVGASVTITQQGYPDETVSLPQGAKYDTIIKGTSGISFVSYHGKYGYIDSTGKELTPLKYTLTKEISAYNYWETRETFWDANDMLVRVYNQGKYGYIDCKGREVVPLQYDYIGSSSLEYGISTTCIRKNGKYGLLGGNGKEIVPCIYEGFCGGSYHDDIEPIAFKKNGKWALFDRTGKQLTNFLYDSICDFGYPSLNSYPLFCQVIENGKHGYLNYKGEVVITPKYEKALSFHNNRAFVQINGKCGYIDNKGNVVIPCKYRWDGWSGFYDGIAWVLDNEGYKQMDTNGNDISTKHYNKITSHSSSWRFGKNIGYYTAYRDGQNIIVGNYGKEYLSEKMYKDDVEGMITAVQKGSIGEMQVLYNKYLREGDSVKSFELCFQAAQSVAPEIWTDLAKKYYYGIGVSKNYQEAYKWFEKAANAYNGEAFRYMGWMLWEGQGCTKDKEKAYRMEINSLLSGNDMAYDDMRKLRMNVTGIKPY